MAAPHVINKRRKVIILLILALGIIYILHNGMTFLVGIPLKPEAIVSQCIRMIQDSTVNTSHEEAIGSNKALHFVLSISGNVNVIRAAAMLKSMLYFRGHLRNSVEQCQMPFAQSTRLCPRGDWPSPLDMIVHIFADRTSQSLLERHITRWKLTNVAWIIYTTDHFMPCVNRIPNRHYAGSAALLKMFVPLLLPDTVEKAIFLDVDTLFNYDVLELWKHFDSFDQQQILGAAFEQHVINHRCRSELTGANHSLGINGGLLLVHLARLRKLEYARFLNEEIQNYFRRENILTEGEQIIWNFIIRNHPPFFYILPCEWNVQTYWPDGPRCCPILWPNRRPDEIDCVTKVHRNGRMHREPNMARLVHIDGKSKPGVELDLHLFDETVLQKRRPLKQDQIRSRFRNMFYQLRGIPMECFT